MILYLQKKRKKSRRTSTSCLWLQQFVQDQIFGSLKEASSAQSSPVHNGDKEEEENKKVRFCGVTIVRNKL